MRQPKNSNEKQPGKPRAHPVNRPKVMEEPNNRDATAARAMIEQIKALEEKFAENHDPTAVHYIGGRQDELRGVVKREGFVYKWVAENPRMAGRPSFYKALAQGWIVADLEGVEEGRVSGKADWSEQKFAVLTKTKDAWEYDRLQVQLEAMKKNGTLRTDEDGEYVVDDVVYSERTKRSVRSAEDLGIPLEVG